MNEHTSQCIKEKIAALGIPDDKKEQLLKDLEKCCETNGNLNEEEKTARYRETDLGYKHKSLFWQRFSTIVSLCGFFFIVAALVINLIQSGLARRSLRANVQQAAVKIVTDLDKVFIDKPELVRYFEGGVDLPINLTNTNSAQVYATAIMFLDTMDFIDGKVMKGQWSTPEAWDEWIIDEFAGSPVLRKVYEGRSNWYGTGLKKLYEKGKQRTAQLNFKSQQDKFGSSTNTNSLSKSQSSKPD